MHKLSPSSLSLFRDCPRCFWLHFRKKIRRPDSIFPSLPSGMDRVLKIHFHYFMKKGELPPELKPVKGHVELFDDEKLLSVWTNNRQGLEWTDKKGNVLRGSVDFILKKGEKLIVLDFKTRGFPLKANTAKYYEDQMDIYNFLLRKNGFKTEDYSYLLFYHPHAVNENGSVVFSTDLVKMKASPARAGRLFSDALATLGGRKPKPSPECGFCSWVKEWD